MKIKLPNSLIKVGLNTNRIRIGMPGQNPIPDVPIITCEVTYDDDTCLQYDDNTYAQYA